MIIATYTWLTAYEFWRGRREPLVSRWPAIVLFATHGAMFILRTPLNAFLHGREGDHILASAWINVLSLEAFLMTIATAFILLAMSKERTELRHKTAAMTDPLTGLLNRRAFLADAEALLQQQIQRDRPIGVLLIDLDHFKSINDRFDTRWATRCCRSLPGPRRRTCARPIWSGVSAARSSPSCWRTPGSTMPIWWPTACATPSRSTPPWSTGRPCARPRASGCR